MPAEATTTNSDTAASGFAEIPVQLPPNLMNLIGYWGDARYVALYYMGSKATWCDGQSSCTFSYYTAYEPLIEHPVMAIHLYDVHLGSDDLHPTHAIICDREKRNFLLGEWEQALKFVRVQEHEPLGEEKLEELREMLEGHLTPAEQQRRGMFELFRKASAGAQHEKMMLLHWLDTFITEELITKLCEMHKQRDLRVWPQIEYIKSLIEKLNRGRAAKKPEAEAVEPTRG